MYAHMRCAPHISSASCICVCTMRQLVLFPGFAGWYCSLSTCGSTVCALVVCCYPAKPGKQQGWLRAHLRLGVFRCTTPGHLFRKSGVA